MYNIIDSDNPSNDRRSLFKKILREHHSLLISQRHFIPYTGNIEQLLQTYDLHQENVTAIMMFRRNPKVKIG